LYNTYNTCYLPVIHIHIESFLNEKKKKEFVAHLIS